MNAMPPKLPKQGRIKDKYRATPSAQEKAYHLWLMEAFPCSCGCGGPSTIVHHPLKQHPAQGARRNHEYVVPMNGFCHFDLHQKYGSEEAYRPGRDFAEMAAMFRDMAYLEGRL